MTGSLALLADAGHMLTDNVALGLALLAAWLTTRPPDAGRTYGYRRAEILAALGNGVGLLVACGFISWEAIKRFGAPHAIEATPMGLVAAGGLIVNIIGVLVLHGEGSLNERSARLHVLGDMLGSVGSARRGAADRVARLAVGRSAGQPRDRGDPPARLRPPGARGVAS
jgi:cobalt-zinc-cadmium efflux system protein